MTVVSQSNHFARSVVGVSVVASMLAAHARVAACERESIIVTAAYLEGDDAPGTGHAFQTFDRPNLSPGGVILFGADTDGPSESDDVLYRGDTLIAREGELAPETGGGVFNSFDPFQTSRHVNASGQVAYAATLRDVPSGAERAVYRSGALIAIAGGRPPGILDRVYEDFSFVGLSDAGAVGFLADLDGSGGDDSVLVFDGTVLYRQGDPVPGLGTARWDGDFDEVQWNGRGDLLFEGNTSLTTDRDVVVFRRTGDAQRGVVEEIVAQEGQGVMARTGEDFLDVVVQTALAEDGTWALRGMLSIAPTSADAIVLTEQGVHAQEGDDVPEWPGVRLGTFNGIAVNAVGDVAYLADLEGDTPPQVDEGIFVGGCLVVSDGMPAPGLPEGTVLSDLGFEDLALNDQRELVFAANFSGTVSGDGLFRVTLPESCPADLDDSGTVDFGDALAVLAVWGLCPSEGPCDEDLDGDGLIDGDDLLAVLSAWGPCP